jgi:amino acid adenylation domain-containing protein
MQPFGHDEVLHDWLKDLPRLEAELARIFARVLDVAEVAAHDNFFGLGGHSLQATELVALLRRAFRVDLPLRSIFEAPTVRDMARYLVVLLDRGAAAPTIATAGSKLLPDRAGKDEPFPLNEVQHAYWIGRSPFFELGNVATHVYAEYESVGLDLPRLERAFQRLVDRHDMLRAVVQADGMQRILPSVPPYRIAVRELFDKSPSEVQAQLQAVRNEMSHRMFSTEQWPLFEIRASRLQGGRVRLHCSLDLLIADLWSTQLIFRELQLFYEKPDTVLPALEISFRDYVLAEPALERREDLQRAKDYWQERLSTLPAAPELPLAQSPAAVTRPHFERRSARLTQARWSRLKTRASRLGLTPSAVLLAAYSEILAAWSGTSRFTINLTLFNRLPVHPEVMSVVGDFTSLTLLEVNLSQAGSFRERAQRIQKQLWEDLDHRQVSGVKVMRDIARSRGSRSALFPVIFTSALVHGESPPPTFLGEEVYAISQTPQIWLDHQVMESGGELTFNWDAVEELFPAGMLDDMFGAYRALLSRLADRENAFEDEVRELLPTYQLEQRARVNATERPLSEHLLHELFIRQASRQPDREAVVSPSRRLTYGELRLRAHDLARRLQLLGTRTEEPVAVMMDRGWQQLVAVLGILEAGAAYVPIDPALPDARCDYLLQCTGARVVVTEAGGKSTWQPRSGMVEIAVHDGEVPVAVGTEEPWRPARAEDLAYIIFTSGSTGTPKGVMIEHRAAVNTILDVNERHRVGPEDRVLSLSSLNFDLSVYDIFGLLAAGGTVVMPAAAGAREPSHWLELLHDEKVTLWNTVPALMTMLVEYAAGRTNAIPSTLRLALLSGDWIPLTLVPSLRSIAPRVRIVSLGGATEAAIWSIEFPIERVDPAWKSVPYGRPLINQRFYVLDEHMSNRPIWVPGGLYIGGAGLARGYWQDDAKTAAAFAVHPRTGERLYKTGDLGRYTPDGNIEFLGRDDFQVKVQGHRIELGEIESALLQCPGVRQAVVQAVGDAQAKRRLVAHLVLDRASASTLFETEDAAGTGGETAWSAAITAGVEQAKRGGLVPAPRDWSELIAELDGLVARTIAGTLFQLGAFRAHDIAYDLDALMSRTRLLPRYRKWLARGLEMLVEDGWLQAEGATWRLGSRPLPAIPEATEWHQLRARAQERGLALGGLDFAWRTAARLSSVVTGDSHAVQALFVEGDSSAAEDMYKGEFDYCNLVAQAAVRALADAGPPSESFRVLEIGAGVGSTTAYLSPTLPPSRAKYVYTDISKYFMSMGMKNFGAHDFFEFKILDIEKDPKLQGFESHAFDLVVAASVLHATRNIDETLENVRTLLRPGGVLLLLEETKFARIFNLTMGLQQGFDRFEDETVRRGHPLLDGGEWTAALERHGFGRVVRLVRPNTTADLLGFEVLLAEGPLQIRRFRDAPLRQFLAQKLPDYMVPGSFTIVDRMPLSPNGKVDRAALPVAEQFRMERVRPFVPPAGHTEKTIARIWSEVLGVDKVSADDSFFDLGGDSLLATQVVTQVRQHFQVELAIRSLFETPTVTGVARRVEAMAGFVAKAAHDYADE